MTAPSPTTDDPVALAVRVRTHRARAGRPAVRTVVVACPFGCGRRHTHGWPTSDTVTTWRSSHCAGGSRGSYRIVVPPELQR